MTLWNFVLQVIYNLKMRQNMLVIGPVGSNKSSVIQTLGVTWNSLGS